MKIFRRNLRAPFFIAYKKFFCYNLRGQLKIFWEEFIWLIHLLVINVLIAVRR